MQSVAAVLTETIIDVTDAEHRIETPRLSMRAPRTSDFQHYFDLMSDPAVMRYAGLEQGKTPSAEEVRTILDGAVNAWKTRGYGRWSVFDRVTDEFVGFVGFRCEGGVPELLAFVHEQYWGNGWSREAVEGVLDYGFNKLGFSVVCSFTRPEHERARALLEKIGAEFTGHVDFHGVEGAAYRIRPNRF